MHAPNGGAGWERLFWLVFARSSNPIVLLDDERVIVDANEAGLTLLNRTREEVIGTSIVDSIRPEERALATIEWQAFLRSGENSGTRILVRADGSEVEVDFAARLALVGGRRLAIYVAIAREEAPAPSSPEVAARLPLTSREREVVTLIALGRSTTQIAQEMHISAETVRTHVRNSMSKLGVHTRAQLVAVVLCTEKAVHPSHLEDRPA